MLDTEAVIAALDRSNAHDRLAAAAVTRMVDDELELLICTINCAEALVRPAEDDKTLQVAVDALAALGVRSLARSAAVARDAARFRSLGISLADGFARWRPHAAAPPKSRRSMPSPADDDQARPRSPREP